MSLSDFNSNPVCAGVGPTALAEEPKNIGELAAYIAVGVFMILTSGIYMYMRQYRRRLRIRSLNPIVMGSIGSAIVIFIRGAYNYVGRQYLPCSSNLVLVYFFFILNLVPDNLLVTSFLVKQKFREMVMTKGLLIHGKSVGMSQQHQSANHRVNPSGSDLGLESSASSKNRIIRDPQAKRSDPNSSGAFNTNQSQREQDAHSSTQLFGSMVHTPVSWFKGFWNHFSQLRDSVEFRAGEEIQFHDNWLFKEQITMSPLIELSYDIPSSLLFAGSMFLGFGLRLGLVPYLSPHNGCTGCQLAWEELPILFACIMWLGLLQILALYRTQRISDPLGYRQDLLVSTSITGIAWIGYILVVVDPGDLMRQQKIDWFFLESFAALLLHSHRCLFQIYRVSRLHRLAEQRIRLIDLLQDQRGSILFEKYLMGELASENLLFWREGIKYKLNFDRNRDLEYSQQVAKVLFRTFVSKNAHLPVNISGALRDTIEARFRSGFVGKTVFDEALVEIYSMMQNGPFYRFVRSKEFLEYARTNADFSGLPGMMQTTGSSAVGGGSGATTSVSLVPLVVDGDAEARTAMSNGRLPPPAPGGEFHITQYINKL